MAKGDIIFNKVAIESFLGISPDSPVTIVFPQDWSGGMLLTGDQETGKSSTLAAIEASIGGTFGDAYRNNKSNDKSIWNEFSVDGVQYRSRLTKTQYKLEVLQDIAGKSKFISVGEDKTTIRRLLPYMTSPEILKDSDPAEQIKWLRTVAGSTSDDTELVEKHKKVYSERTGVNRDVETFKKLLLDSKNFVNEGKDIKPTEEFQSMQEDVLTKDVDKVAEMLETSIVSLKKQESDYNKANAAISTYEYQIDEKKKQIERINQEIKEFETRIQQGKDYLEANKDIQTKLKEVESELDNVREVKSLKDNILTTNRNYSSYKTAFDKAIILTSEIDSIKKQREAIAKSFTPPIDGLEVKLGGNIDDDKKGLFYQGVNISTLSESARYGLVIQIVKHYGTRILFIENISDLGSKAVEIIKMFMDEGGVVFATKMQRSNKKMVVSFNLKEIIIDEEEE